MKLPTWTGEGRTEHEIAKFSAKDAARYPVYQAEIRRVVDALRGLALAAPPNLTGDLRVAVPGSRQQVCYGEIAGDLARNAHQEFAEILSAQEADEGPRSVLETLNHVFAIFDSSLADPGRDIAYEIAITRRKVGNDETAKRQPFARVGSTFCRPEPSDRA